MATVPKCTMPECDRGVRRKKLGLCDPHIEKQRAERGEYCAFEACNRGHISAGYCAGHYSQKRLGVEMAPLKDGTRAQCGTTTKYGNGCRCEDCREAKRVQVKAWRDDYRLEHGQGYYTGAAHRGTRTTYDRDCEYCGGAYQTRTYIARYCTQECAQRDRWGWSKSREVMLYTKPYTYKPTTAPLNVVRGKGQYIVGQCVVCNTSFITRHVDITCSDECQDERARDIKHSAEQRRRARERKAFAANVNRKQIFKRDGHRCHICKAKTNPKAKVPNPNAPTIDHLIPLSKGGTHEPSNVATACFMCNCIKSDRGTGDQLLLFG